MSLLRLTPPLAAGTLQRTFRLRAHLQAPLRTRLDGPNVRGNTPSKSASVSIAPNAPTANSGDRVGFQISIDYTGAMRLPGQNSSGELGNVYEMFLQGNQRFINRIKALL